MYLQLVGSCKGRARSFATACPYQSRSSPLWPSVSTLFLTRTVCGVVTMAPPGCGPTSEILGPGSLRVHTSKGGEVACNRPSLAGRRSPPSAQHDRPLLRGNGGLRAD